MPRLRIILGFRPTGWTPPEESPRVWTVWCSTRHTKKGGTKAERERPRYLVMICADSADEANRIARVKGHFVLGVAP